ncbi:hypothetical protein AgCh_030090 [Apium graveolens]
MKHALVQSEGRGQHSCKNQRTIIWGSKRMCKNDPYACAKAVERSLRMCKSCGTIPTSAIEKAASRLIRDLEFKRKALSQELQNHPYTCLRAIKRYHKNCRTIPRTIPKALSQELQNNPYTRIRAI